METNPYELISDDGMDLLLSRGGKAILGIPVEIIEKADFVQKKGTYGIALTLHREVKKRMTRYDRRYKPVKTGESTLFLPYFSQRSCGELQQFLS